MTYLALFQVGGGLVVQTSATATMTSCLFSQNNAVVSALPTTRLNASIFLVKQKLFNSYVSFCIILCV
jgi:hypothetical protein